MIRTRFAPSPTGELHAGGVRTALFAWLLARHYNGQFVLRIEDTDLTRSTSQNTQIILDSLKWLHLECDIGPFFQSQRSSYYQSALNQLLKSGQAYYCDCSLERLQQLRALQLAQKKKPRYDNHCRDRGLIPSSDTVVRFKNPQTGHTIVEDKVLGDVTFANNELDDFILVRSDGTPTYNFTVVVDDCEMNITHVIRGNDHLNNTPRQINLLKALNQPIPTYFHLPMIQGENGKKLSKREDAMSILEYKKEGFLSEALINYLVRLGWSHQDQEIFSREALIQYFDGTHLSKSPARMNHSKLLWLNQQYLKTENTQKIADLLKPFTQDWKISNNPTVDLYDISLIQKDRVSTLKEMADKSRFFYEMPAAALKPLEEQFLPIITLLYSRFDKVLYWEKKTIALILQQVIRLYQLKPGQLFQPLRIILTGSEVSPPMDSTIHILGKAQVLHRLKQAIQGSGI